MKSDLGITAIASDSSRRKRSSLPVMRPIFFAAVPQGFCGALSRPPTLAPADELLAQMRAIKTAAEIQHIRTACVIAEQAFLHGSDQVARWLDGGSDSGSVSSSAEFVSGGLRARESLRRLYLLHVRAELGPRIWPIFPFTRPKD